MLRRPNFSQLLSESEKFHGVFHATPAFAVRGGASYTGRMEGDLVFRSICVDLDVDAALRAQAAKEGISKGEMCRRYLRAGLARMNKVSPIPPAPREVSLGMRTVYLAADMDVAVRRLAREARALQTDVIRHAMRTGMKALEAKASKGKS